MCNEKKKMIEPFKIEIRTSACGKKGSNERVRLM